MIVFVTAGYATVAGTRVRVRQFVEQLAGVRRWPAGLVLVETAPARAAVGGVRAALPRSRAQFDLRRQQRPGTTARSHRVQGSIFHKYILHLCKDY